MTTLLRELLVKQSLQHCTMLGQHIAIKTTIYLDGDVQHTMLEVAPDPTLVAKHQQGLTLLLEQLNTEKDRLKQFTSGISLAGLTGAMAYLLELEKLLNFTADLKATVVTLLLGGAIAYGARAVLHALAKHYVARGLPYRE